MKEMTKIFKKSLWFRGCKIPRKACDGKILGTGSWKKNQTVDSWGEIKNGGFLFRAFKKSP